MLKFLKYKSDSTHIKLKISQDSVIRSQDRVNHGMRRESGDWCLGRLLDGWVFVIL